MTVRVSRVPGGVLVAGVHEDVWPVEQVRALALVADRAGCARFAAALRAELAAR